MHGQDKLLDFCKVDFRTLSMERLWFVADITSDACLKRLALSSRLFGLRDGDKS
jgi:hypothetical protein